MKRFWLLLRMVAAPALACAARALDGLPKRGRVLSRRSRRKKFRFAEQIRALRAELNLKRMYSKAARRELARARKAALGDERSSELSLVEIVRCLRESHDELLHTVLEQVSTIVTLTSELEAKSHDDARLSGIAETIRKAEAAGVVSSALTADIVTMAEMGR